MNGLEKRFYYLLSQPDFKVPGTRAEQAKKLASEARVFLAKRVKSNLGRITECARGHTFTPDNTVIHPTTGRRECRTCRNIRQAKYRENKNISVP